MPTASAASEIHVHDHIELVAVLPASGSYGQLFVYDAVSPGRAAAVVHAAQDRNAVSWSASAGDRTVSGWMPIAGSPARNRSRYADRICPKAAVCPVVK